MNASDKAKELVEKYDQTFTYLESKNKAKQCAIIAVDNEINLIKRIIDESTNIHQSLSTPKKLCIDILNPILKELEETKKQIELM